MPGGGAYTGTGLGGAAEQAAAVGLGEALRGVEERFVEHGGRSPIAGAFVRLRGVVVAGLPVARAAGRYPGRRASSTRRTGMPSRTGYARPQS
ncbi:hypothetical protein STENM223S_08802 [Streptomyces tendae]